MRAFITGTDTGVGKTHVTALILRHLHGVTGQSTVGFKPFCSGGREDAEILREASSPVPDSLDEINPCWWETPVAPSLAARWENKPADTGSICRALQKLTGLYHHVLIEGAGGWLAPLTDEMTVEDFALDAGWPVVVVAAQRLGMISHTLLTVERIMAHGLVCPGIILNHPTAACAAGDQDALFEGNRQELKRLSPVPVIGEVLFRQNQLPLDFFHGHIEL